MYRAGGYILHTCSTIEFNALYNMFQSECRTCKFRNTSLLFCLFTNPSHLPTMLKGPFHMKYKSFPIASLSFLMSYDYRYCFIADKNLLLPSR
jgi:hypothetical protein